MCAMFYFSLKCYSEDIDKEALLSGTPMYLTHIPHHSTHLHIFYSYTQFTYTYYVYF